MSVTITEHISVLVVDDDPEFTDLYERMLSDEYSIKTANSATEALDYDLDTFDVILLDRDMPDASGDEALEEFRLQGIDCPVAMVTAVEPDVDILDLPFDEYLQKPVEAEELRSTVRRLAYRGAFEAKSREFFQLVAKKTSLDTSDHHARESSEYARLVDQIEDLKHQIGETMTEATARTITVPSYDDLGPDESAQLIQGIFDHELPPDLAELVDAYQELPGARPHFMWKWVHRLAPQNTLPCVESVYRDRVPVDKTITILFITLLDDCLEKRGDRDTFAELCRVPDPVQTPDLEHPGVDATYVEFTMRVWNTLMSRISNAPQYEAYVDLFYHDIRQAVNAVAYSEIPTRSPDLATMSDLERVETHNMGMYAYADIDLMHSPSEVRNDLPAIRDALWDAQLMARIGNWVSTWERELREGDFSAGPVVFAREQGVVSHEELEHLTADSGPGADELVDKIREAGIEQEFLRRWEHHHYELQEQNRRIDSFDLSPFIEGMEEVLRYHLASTGLK